MLSLNGILELLNDKAYKPPEKLNRWKNVYYGMSLHIDGVCPYFQYLRRPELGWIDSNLSRIYPNNWYGMEYQNLFENYLLNRHPRENELTRQWRLSQYKPFTQDPFQKVIQVITGAIFQDSGYSITLDDNDDNDYIWNNNFEGKTLVGFIADKFQMISEDPNGYFVVMPKEPWYATTTPKIEPVIHFVKSCHIKYVTLDELIYCDCEDEKLYWVVNKIGVFRFYEESKDKFVHIDEAQGGYYGHMFGRVPAYKAGGIWNAQGFYDSWLVAAKPVADEFVSAKSAEQLVNKEASHPFIVEASEECPDCNHTGKIQRKCDDCEGGWELIACTRCGGDGQISHNPGDRLIAPKEDMAHSLIQIVNPDVDVNKFHAENNAALYNSMLKALHLHVIEEAQSGTAKDKDMETRYQFILRISNDIFDRLIPAFITDISAYRNVTASGGTVVPTAGDYVIVKPTQFQIKTAQDLLDEYNTSTKAMVPDFMRMRQLEDYADKQFGGDDVLKRKTVLINQMDVLAVTPDSNIPGKVLSGAVDSRKVQFHTYLPQILDQIVREKSSEWFLKATYDQIKAEVDRIFDRDVPKPITVEYEQSNDD